MTGQVVCMVRGGEAGRATQNEAIQFVKKQEKQLVFLHIINPKGMSLENVELLQPLTEELTWLARVNLSQARQRADRRGIKAELAILNGPLFETVIAYIRENPVERLYLGLPRKDLADYEQRLAGVKAFADRLHQASKVEVVMV